MLPRLPSVFCRLVCNHQGVTAIEYSLLVALLSIAAVTALNTLGQEIQNVLNAATSALS